MNPNLSLHRVLLVLAASLWMALPARASAPQLKTSAPGYYRLMVGDIEVTPLCDGVLPVQVDQLLTNVSAQELKSALAAAFLSAHLNLSVNGFLVNTGTKLVLIDTGAGRQFGPTAGKLRANLAAAGYQPSQVDEIYITHMHGDHIGGLLAEGKPAFANAVVRASRQEAEYWLSQERLEAAPKDQKSTFQSARTALDPYRQAGRFKPFDGESELVPGVRARPAPGHTPGHTLYVIESRGQTLLLWGDLMHIAAVQFPDPAVTIQFDSDSTAAAAVRGQVFSEAAAAGYLIGGAHLSFPGIGHLRAAGKGYVFVPVNYDDMR